MNLKNLLRKLCKILVGYPIKIAINILKLIYRVVCGEKYSDGEEEKTLEVVQNKIEKIKEAEIKLKDRIEILKKEEQILKNDKEKLLKDWENLKKREAELSKKEEKIIFTENKNREYQEKSVKELEKEKELLRIRAEQIKEQEKRNEELKRQEEIRKRELERQREIDSRNREKDDLQIGIAIKSPLKNEKKEIKEEKIFLFKDIDENDEVFNRIFKETEIVKANLSLPEQDKNINLIKLNQFENKIKKLKDKINKNIENDDIDEDEYSAEVTYKFIDILDSEYTPILKNLALKDDESFKKAYELVENFLIKIGFRKYVIDTDKLDDNNKDIIESFKINTVTVKDINENNKIRKILMYPYYIYLKEDDEDVKHYLLGELILGKYKG